MKSYPPVIGGRHTEPSQWSHIIPAREILLDPISLLNLKRKLDRGQEPEPDGIVTARVGMSTPDENAEALRTARIAQRAWGRRSLESRIEMGLAFHELVRQRADEFVEVLVVEGHARRLAEWEVQGVVAGSSPEMYTMLAPHLERTTHTGDGVKRLVRKPDGVVCLNPPANAAASNSCMAIPILVAGNAVVVRAPLTTPYGVAWVWHELIAPLLAEFDAPLGIGSLVCGQPREILDLWVRHRDVDDVLYFGSSERGLAYARECEQAGKKAILELAGNDAVLVWRDADLDAASEAAAQAFYGSTQICMVPKQLIVHADVAEEFLKRVTARVADIRPGLPDESDALLSPVLRSDDFDRVLEDAISQGATLVCGGRRLDHTGQQDRSGVFLEPTIIRVDGLAAAASMEAVRRETFFPLLPVVVVEQGGDTDIEFFDRLVDFIEDNSYGLRNSFWCNDSGLIDRYVSGLRNGGLIKVNQSHVDFLAGLPTHGGTGWTGGVHGEANFPILRTSHLQGISVTYPRTSAFDYRGGR